ncbi:hypothetical protein M758_UG238300 [Ceratodon purpureus]|nr:hypothetical protein M758_UG238300 [Ceratodon purpureus]
MSRAPCRRLLTHQCPQRKCAKEDGVEGYKERSRGRSRSDGSRIEEDIRPVSFCFDSLMWFSNCSGRFCVLCAWLLG